MMKFLKLLFTDKVCCIYKDHTVSIILQIWSRYRAFKVHTGYIFLRLLNANDMELPMLLSIMIPPFVDLTASNDQLPYHSYLGYVMIVCVLVSQVEILNTSFLIPSASGVSALQGSPIVQELRQLDVEKFKTVLIFWGGGFFF